jgi:hypothetical protein
VVKISTLPSTRRAARRRSPLLSFPPSPPIPPLCPYTDTAPISTPQAIAGGSGWGCFVGQVSSPPLLLPLVSSHRPLIIITVSSPHANPQTTPRADAHRRGAGVMACSPSSPLPLIFPPHRRSTTNHPTSSCS